MMSTAWLVAAVSLLTGTAAIYMALLEPFPVSWLYYHYFIRKPLAWALLLILAGLLVYDSFRDGSVSPEFVFPVLIGVAGVALTYRMHQEAAFRADDFPATTTDHDGLPLSDDMEIAVIEYDGVIRGYPLDYVIHHHIVNDRFNDSLVALTYCAMCRSVIPFDVTALGPLFVASFKGANMLVADRKTKTFFQQATFNSIIGPLHPSTLKMIPFQILAWKQVKEIRPRIPVVNVTLRDLRQFELPLPGIWRKIVASDSTPGLSSRNRDHSFPPRTRVIGVLEPDMVPRPVYLKSEVLRNKMITNSEQGFILVGIMNMVNGFKVGKHQSFLLKGDVLEDQKSQMRFDIRGKSLQPGTADLLPVALSDEYWFSWKKYHDDTLLIRI